MDMEAMIAWVRVQIRDVCASTPANHAFTDDELQQFIEDALREFSRGRALRRPITLEIVAGTTEYSLPDDWMSADMETFQAVTDPGQAVDLTEFQLPLSIITPVPFTVRYEWYDALRQLVLTDAPQRDFTLNFSYFAWYTPETVPDHLLDAALAPAIVNALMALATDMGVRIQSYKIANNIAVDNRKIAENLRADAATWAAKFRRDVVMRPCGGMGRPDPHVSW